MTRETDPSLAYLLGRLAIVEARVRAAVDRRRVDDPDPGDRFRGLYISDAQVDGLLASPAVAMIEEAWAAAAVDQGDGRTSGSGALRARSSWDRTTSSSC